MMIKNNQLLEFYNLLSFRGKIAHCSQDSVISKMIQLIVGQGASKNGPVITTTYSVEQTGNQLMMDIEVLIPVNKIIEVTNDYTFKPHFRLENAVSLKHEGAPNNIQKSADKLMEYIYENKLTPITTGYNVFSDCNEGEMINIDMYVGVSSNIL